ncbi:hypothetical protein SLOPH_843 [Spraguea lophii 42_110]|uniref:Uncharacterized protein n=1 Tax=Spraguea lophii (strain 42_110) TaxID=1358809 RepID=S7XTP8_SPRLO|nr:hypothetical protein SLOPH_843 [Spraguea lophii 42_110]
MSPIAASSSLKLIFISFFIFSKINNDSINLRVKKIIIFFNKKLESYMLIYLSYGIFIYISFLIGYGLRLSFNIFKSIITNFKHMYINIISHLFMIIKILRMVQSSLYHQ